MNNPIIGEDSKRKEERKKERKKERKARKLKEGVPFNGRLGLKGFPQEIKEEGKGVVEGHLLEENGKAEEHGAQIDAPT